MIVGRGIKRAWAGLAALILLTGLLGTPGVTLAHADVASSIPADGATVPAGLQQVVITFSEEVSPEQSSAEFVMSGGMTMQATSTVDRADRTKMTVGFASGLPAGSYSVKWNAVTQDDNGITDGTINFTVAAASQDCNTFNETGQTVCGRFLEYWNTHGGLAQQGFPISGELQEKSDTDGKTYTVQYFERAVFEKHPENAAPNDVLLSLLGTFLYKQKYPDGAPNQQASSTNARTFPETGMTVGGKFIDYWDTHGGLAQQGFPISNEFEEKSDLDGNTYLVQYFERAVFEYHPENDAPNDVLLSQLGTFRYHAVYAAASVNVNIVDFKFDPAVITITTGTKVTWTEVGPTEHNTVSKADPPLWDSPILQIGDTFSYVFNEAGTFDYWCTIHPEMLGTVVVVNN
jgi:plastocyanin/methionine-rich copper-binding protein CopC